MTYDRKTSRRLNTRLRKLLATLSILELHLLDHRAFADLEDKEPESLASIARRFDISPARVHQVEILLFRKLRSAVSIAGVTFDA